MVQAVVLDGDRVLFARRDTLRGFELPGGNLRAGESPERGLAREVREETGLDVDVRHRVGTYTRTGFFAHRAEVFLCAVRGGALRPSRETPELRWFPGHAPPSDLFRWFRGPLEDALAGARDAEREEHQGIGAIWHGLRIDVQSRWRG